MKKSISILISFVILLTMIVPFTAFGATINATSANIYCLASTYDKYLKLPSGSNKHQITVSGASNVSYKVISGDSAVVSSKGLVTPKATTYYWYGSIGYTYEAYPNQTPTSVTTSYNPGVTVIKVTAGSQSFNVKVTVSDYAEKYANDVMDNYIKKNIPNSMTDEQKLNKIGEFIASYEYSASYSSATGMIVTGGGDCWSSTDTAIKMSKKLGFDAWARNGNRDPGAGSGHMNAIVKVSDGSHYIIEAGFYMAAPRFYEVYKVTSLFSYRSYEDGIELYQYDGKTYPKSFTIPKKIDGKTVLSLGEGFIQRADITSVSIPDTVKNISNSAFNSCENLTSITIPASVETIGNFVFTNCNKLTTITSNSKNYIAKSGVLYNSDKTELLYAPAVSSITVPSTVKSIGEYAFYYNNNLNSVYIPKNVKVVKEGAFACCNNLKKVSFYCNGVNEIDQFAFAQDYKLEAINLPSSINVMQDYIFYNAESSVVPTVASNSVAYKYLAKNNIQYKISSKTLHQKDVLIDTIPATRSENGSKKYKCDSCGKTHSKTVYKIDKATLSKTSYVYDGNAKKPAVTVKDSKGNKISSSNYTVTYSNNTKVGKATVKITFKGSYKGTITKTFKIKPKSTTIASLTAASKGFTVKWKKQATQTSGYQIRYSTSSKMTKAKTVTVSKNSTVSKKITKLTGGKKYYVQVRTYKTVNGTKYYSSWSAKKTVTTKK